MTFLLQESGIEEKCKILLNCGSLESGEFELIGSRVSLNTKQYLDAEEEALDKGVVIR